LASAGCGAGRDANGGPSCEGRRWRWLR
jgi:hypothetical protein